MWHQLWRKTLMTISVPEVQPVQGRSFRIALVQLGNIGFDKAKNLAHAQSQILRAAQATPKTDLIVLPECFNSPYGVDHFGQFAEDIGFQPGTPYDVSSSESESIKMLSQVAKQTGVWLFGGASVLRP